MHKRALTTQFPSPIKRCGVPLNNEQKVDFIAARFKEIMEALELDLEGSLSSTPQRVAKMYVEEIFTGLNEENFPAVSPMDNFCPQEIGQQIVFVKNRFTSFCEHHFVPFSGTAYVAYLPHEKLIGLGDIPRVVRYFAKRPQLQERLTAQIADALSLILETESVAVSLVASHYCIIARDVEDENSRVVTNVLRGDFRNDPLRQSEFFDAIKRTH